MTLSDKRGMIFLNASEASVKDTPLRWQVTSQTRLQDSASVI